MLQRLLDLKPQVLCDTAHGAITGLLQQLLVTGHAAVDLVGRAADPSTADARAVFDAVRSILVQSHFIDADTPLSETKAGIQKIRVPNPYYRSLHLPVRSRIDDRVTLPLCFFTPSSCCACGTRPPWIQSDYAARDIHSGRLRTRCSVRCGLLLERYP